MKKRRPLGQNFLTDANIARHIVQLANVRGPVLEIGPGKGVLTQYLLELGPVTAVEIDPGLCDLLEKRFGGNPDFRLIRADAVKFDYSALGSQFQAVSNLPYYAAMPIMKRLIHYRAVIRDMTLMLQKEVVDRLVASPGCRDYGSLTVFTQYHCEVERLLEVGKASFSPAPKVDSAVIRLIPRPHPPVQVADTAAFFKIVHAAFFHKRKMLKNNLRRLEKHFTIDPEKIHDTGIDLTRRGETLSLEDFATLANSVESKHD